MSRAQAVDVAFSLDPSNPGQFFACCGLFEMAARKWGAGTLAAFSESAQIFVIRAPEASGDVSRERLLHDLGSCAITNTMTSVQVARLDELGGFKKREREAAGLDQEMASLESLRRDAPILMGEPFHMVIDWHQDDRAGGADFKTWAGQQSILDIASGMRDGVASVLASNSVTASVLTLPARSIGLPFNFDSDLGGQGAALDVGFSFDPLKNMTVGVRPVLELCAFIGLERFRPRGDKRENRFRYCAWSEFLPTSIASAAACGALRLGDDPEFEFPLLYRTKYLKSFLPAKQIRGKQ